MLIYVNFLQSYRGLNESTDWRQKNTSSVTLSARIAVKTEWAVLPFITCMAIRLIFSKFFATTVIHFDMAATTHGRMLNMIARSIIAMEDQNG